MNTRELLAAVRAAQGIPSNYRLARLLDVPETTVQRWNTGRNLPDDTMAARLAELAGLDAGTVVASIHAERAPDDGTRALWQSIAQRLQHAGAAVLAVVLSVLFFGTPDAQARASIEESATSGAPAAVVQSHHWRGLLRRLAAWVVKISPRLPMVTAWDYT